MMTKKTTKKRATSAIPAKAVTDATDKPKPKTLSPHEVVTSSVIQNAIGIYAWSKFAGEADLGELVKTLSERLAKVEAGDMTPVENMLFGQAKTLETMFTSLARRAASNDGLKQFQCNLTLALKAQAQCRATLEALAEIKNPRPVSFVKQANISNGPQQVNNSADGARSAQARAHAGNSQTLQNELLEERHGNTLDTGAQSHAGGADTHLEAVGTGQRAAHA